MPGCEALLCAEERYGAEEAIFLEKAVDIQNFSSLRAANHVEHGGRHAARPRGACGAHFLKCLPLT